MTAQADLTETHGFPKASAASINSRNKPHQKEGEFICAMPRCAPEKIYVRTVLYSSKPELRILPLLRY
jgi:hypothetical protein